MSQLPTYDETSAALQPLKADASETHGMACGFISGKISNRGLAQWQHLLLGVEDDIEILNQLFDATRKQFSANNFTLQLLIPDEDTSLPDRTKALTSWCKGFISGLGEAQQHSKQYDNDEIQEVLSELDQISRASYQNLESTPENEQDFFEIQEHVRLSALFIFTELRLLAQKEELSKMH
jgi:uncharacterized protein